MMNETIPTISLVFRKDCIRIHKRTLDMLGNPAYVLLMVNPQKQMICVQAGEAEDPSSHRVVCYRTKHNYAELYSKSLMETLLGCGEWDQTNNYRLSGALVNKDTAVFCFHEMKPKE